MILGLLLFSTITFLCLCYDYYTIHEPLHGSDDGFKLFYVENDTTVPGCIVQQLMVPPLSKDGELTKPFSFEVRVPEHIIKEFNDTYTYPNGTNKYGSE